jgi:hypothetical protein
MVLQVHNRLQLHLKGVKVQPGTSRYSIIVGCDVLAPTANFRGCYIAPGSGTEWRSKDGTNCWMPVYRGPRGQEPVVAAAAEETLLAPAKPPGGTGSRPATSKGPSATDKGHREYLWATALP